MGFWSQLAASKRLPKHLLLGIAASKRLPKHFLLGIAASKRLPKHFLLGIGNRLAGSSTGQYQGFVQEVNSFEPDLEKLTDDQLRARSQELGRQIKEAVNRQLADPEGPLERREQNERRRQIIQAVLSPHIAYAFSLVREAAKRTIGQRHFDVQLIGGLALHQGQIAEMKTGEGKTLVASLSLYLNALTGLGAHLITVNDYLARLGAGWMGRIYHQLGMSVGIIGPQFSYLFDPSITNEEKDWRLQHFRPVSRGEAYQADVTYGTNNEFGFDYLRDNMAQELGQMVQRELAYAIVDEVDSILIDEARTPLIISAPSSQAAQTYQKFAQFMPKLKIEADFRLDEKARTASLTSAGIKKLESLIGVNNLYDPANVKLVHYVDESLKAYALFKRDRDYVVKNDEVAIVDEFTGRLLHGRRYSGGLHQAIEAKEKVPVKEESLTLATITFQNYFRLYYKLAGMTGTAMTEAEEFAKIYRLEVVAIPTHRPVVRLDRQDAIYKTEAAKFRAIVDQVRQLNAAGQPVLIGTVSIDKSERLSRLLKASGIKPNVLNAKQHQKESEIIAEAGRKGTVTVATNMAGRGVDIVLGGRAPTESSSSAEVKGWEQAHQEIIKLGGLFVIGTERHEARRIDNQLRGRAGRQGDPGASQFYISMEDDLMRIFGGERMKRLMERLNIPEDTSINNSLLTRAIEQSQTRVEGHNFDLRKHLLEYDDVMNKHREAIYRRRQRTLRLPAEDLHQETVTLFPPESVPPYRDHSSRWSPELRGQIERAVTLRAIDVLWIDHLTAMEQLRESIGLRGYGQREPIVEYKQEAYRLFTELTATINAQILDMLLHVTVEQQPRPEDLEPAGQATILTGSQGYESSPQSAERAKVGRNDPCPCGAIDPKTGRAYKYKKCGLIKAPYHRT